MDFKLTQYILFTPLQWSFGEFSIIGGQLVFENIYFLEKNNNRQPYKNTNATTSVLHHCLLTRLIHLKCLINGWICIHCLRTKHSLCWEELRRVDHRMLSLLLESAEWRQVMESWLLSHETVIITLHILAWCWWCWWCWWQGASPVKVVSREESLYWVAGSRRSTLSYTV